MITQVFKRIAAFALALTLVLSVCAVPVFADAEMPRLDRKSVV